MQGDNDNIAQSPPAWRLDDLFPGKDSPELAAALAQLERDVAQFTTDYRGRLSKMSGAEFGRAIAAYEAISESAARIHTYAYLTAAADAAENGWAHSLSQRVQRMTEQTLFFTIEINDMAEDDLFALLADPAVASYGPWLGRMRAGRAHMLDEPREKYLSRKSAVAEDAWMRLFDQTILSLRFTLDGREMGATEILSLMTSTDDRAQRRAAFAEFGRVLGENAKVFALITNTLADLKAADDERRDFDTPEAARHLSNQIEPAVVEAMAKAVRDSYASTAHRYYAWKARKFGTARLHAADRNAPLPQAARRTVSWDEARQIVLSAYAGLSPRMADIARDFFDKSWIDAAPRPTKRGGAFAHPSVPSVHPYVLMSYYGTPRDVQTLAHELGHGVHQVLAGKQGYLKSATPLTLAETASVFGEMLVFRAQLDAEQDLPTRRNMIAEKVESMLNTVVRQTAFYTFEQRVHAARREEGELPPEKISAIWQETQKESLGPAVNLEVAGAQNFWMYIPHFIHSPFYVYAYAFGDCLVNALYDEYQTCADKQGFVEKYLALLEAGGTQKQNRALAAFGFDTADPAFWRKGLSVIERYIDELHAIDAALAQKPPAPAAFNGRAARQNKAATPARKKKGPQP